MFYHIDQPRTPSFPIGLTKTESDFIFGLVDTGIGRLAYPFVAFSNLTCHLEDTGIDVFWLHRAVW